MNIKITLAGLFLGLAAAFAQPEDYADWIHFRTFDLKPSLNNPVTNFPMLVRLDASNAADVFSGAKSGGADLRFRRAASQSSESLTDHQLPYQIAYWDSAARKAEIWVLVDSLYNVGENPGPYPQALYLYWGKPDAPARSNAAAVFDTANGFVGVWHMGGSSPTAARANAVPGGNPAVPSGSNVATGFPMRAGIIGLADTLRGGTDGGANAFDDHFNLGSLTADFSAGMTMSMWIKPASPATSAWNVFMAFGNGAPGDNLTLGRMGGTNNLFGEVYDGTLGAGRTATDNTVQYNEWQYVAFAVQDSSQTVNWFASYSSSRTRTATATIPNVTRDMAYLGRSLWPDPNPAVAIDEVRLSKVRRSLDWIRLEFQSQYPNNSQTVQKAPNPTAPALSAPAANATGVPAFVTLSWENLSSTYKYRVQVSTDSFFTTKVVDTLLSGASRSVGPLSGSTTYYWRVLAWSSSNGTSPWTATRKFTVGLEPPEVGMVTLAAPAPFATGQSLSPALSWNHASGATSYQAQVAAVPNFSAHIMNDSGTAALSRTVGPLTTSTEFYWRVRGRNHLGAGPWSEVRSFTTVATVPAAPTLTSPAAFATNVTAASPILSWTASPGATSYRVQVSLASAFTSFVVNDSTVTGTSRTLGTLAGFTDYYWRVNAKNSAGTSEFSLARRFTTGEPVALQTSGKPWQGEFFVSPGRVGTTTFLRFGLPLGEKVIVRLRDLRGARTTVVWDGWLESGIHTLDLPQGLSMGPRVLEFRAGIIRKTIMVGP